MAYKVFIPGDEALAADVNGLLMAQTVSRFANAAARTAAIAAPVVNQLTMLDTSPGVIQYWTGSAWAIQPGMLVRYAASNPNLVAAADTDFILTSFTMPVTGAVILTGSVSCVNGGGATALVISMTVNPSPASVPVPSSSVAGLGPSQPANLYWASIPYSAMWGSIAAGTAVTIRLRIGSSAPGTMGSLVSAIQGQLLIAPTVF